MMSIECADFAGRMSW